MREKELLPQIERYSDIVHSKDNLLKNLLFYRQDFLFCSLAATTYAKVRTIEDIRSATIEMYSSDGTRAITQFEDFNLPGYVHPDIETLATHACISARVGFASAIFELIYEYCTHSKQQLLFASQSFYQFSRLLRNSGSHLRGGFLLQWPPNLIKKGVKEIRWRNFVIKDSELGTRLRLSHKDAHDLWIEMYEFCHSQLR